MFKKFWPRLTDQTTQLNFISYLLASLVTVSLYVFINGIQTFTLSILLSVSRQELGNVNGEIVFYDQLLSLALLGSWGALSDRIGRRLIFSSGFLFMGIAMILFPFSQNIYPQLLLCRLLFAVGAAACGGMITAVLADYVDERDKGRVSGLVGLMSGLGALFGALCLARMPSYLSDHYSLAQSIQYSYLIGGSLSIICAIGLGFSLKAADRLVGAQPSKVGTRHSLIEQLRQRIRRNSAELNHTTTAAVVAAAAVNCPYDQLDHGNSDEESDCDAQTPMLGNSRPQSPSGQQKLSADSAGDKQLAASAEERISFGKNKESNSRQVLKSDDSNTADDSGNGASRCTFPGVLEEQQQRQEQHQLQQRSFWRLVWAGLKLISNPYIMLAYLGGFVARGDSIIITLFLPLWINNYFIDQGLCPGGSGGSGGVDSSSIGDNPFPGDPALHRCSEAVSKAFAYSGIAQSFALLGAPLFGYLAHRMRHRRSISFIIASFISFCGYTSLFLIKDPVKDSAAMYPLLCVVGLGEIGMIVTSLSLVTSDAYVMPNIRGSVAGCYSLFGGLGLLILTRLGGFLTEVWVDSAPFLVVGVLAGVICLVGFIVELLNNQWRQRRQQTGHTASAAITTGV